MWACGIFQMYLYVPLSSSFQQNHHSQQQQQQQQQSSAGPGLGSSPTKLANSKLDQVEIDNQDIGMSRPRSLTPDELKQNKKKGGFFSKGKNIFKKFTR